MSKVTMFNPQSGVTQEASQAAYDAQYSKEGWELVADTKPAQKARRGGASRSSSEPAEE